MTHKDIYTKFMIEYDKANVTSSYPSLTEYEVATVLDKAYHALIAQKVTGNNVRRVALEGDLKSISDIAPLITTSTTGALTHVSNSNVVYRTIPEDMLYFVSGSMTQAKANTMDDISPRPLPLKLVNHQIADKFIISAYNMPWIKTPVCYIEDKNLYIVYDSVNTPNITNASVTYIKTPNTFVKDFIHDDRLSLSLKIGDFIMATVEELVKQYETDKALQAEVQAILADGKVSIKEFMAFAKKHDVEISMSDVPKYMEQAKKLGFIK